MSRTPSVDAAVVAARLQVGETRAEIAQRLGTSYANVVAAARRWQRLSGCSLPRARRGRMGPVEIKHVTPRMQAVVAAYRPEGVTMRQVGAQFGKTAEWVRLQLKHLRRLDRRAHRPQAAWQKGAAADHPALPVAVPRLWSEARSDASPGDARPETLPSLRHRACLPAEPHRRALDQGSHGGAELALDRLC